MDCLLPQRLSVRNHIAPTFETHCTGLCGILGISISHIWCDTERGLLCFILFSCCLLAKSCPTVCDPVDCSPPGSSVHGILQARILEWIAMSFSRGFSWPRDQTHISCIGRRALFTTEPPEKAHSVLFWMLKTTASHSIIIGVCNLVSLNEATNSLYSNIPFTWAQVSCFKNMPLMSKSKHHCFPKCPACGFCFVSLLFCFGLATWHARPRFPDHGWKPGSLHWKRGVLMTAPPGNSQFVASIYKSGGNSYLVTPSVVTGRWPHSYVGLSSIPTVLLSLPLKQMICLHLKNCTFTLDVTGVNGNVASPRFFLKRCCLAFFGPKDLFLKSLKVSEFYFAAKM